jgi:dCTP deaminase
MTILSAQSIQSRNILSPCVVSDTFEGVSHGLGPAGYDLRLVLADDDGLTFCENSPHRMRYLLPGGFLLVAAAEHFTMPDDLVGIVHDKSSWARRGLAVQNTIIEPGWKGYLTLELTNHGRELIKLVEGQGIAQVVFHMLDRPTDRPYGGKYQDQQWGPQEARS